jgi:NADH-quinone oxidoreductase subunit M
MGILASLTLVLGLYPDLFYKPIIGYVESLYPDSDVLIPVKITPGTGQGNEGLTNTTQVSNVAFPGGTEYQRTHILTKSHVDHPITF